MASLFCSLLPSLSPLCQKAQNPRRTQTVTLTEKPLSFSLKPLSCTPPSLSSSLLVTHEDLNERDWSFVEPSSDQPLQRLTQVITSTALPPFSRVLVALPTPRFIDALLDPVAGDEPAPLPQQVVAYHESLLILSNVKESHDEVRCFQGNVASVPTKFSPFDAIFVCYFPGMRVSVSELLRSHAPLCSTGSRVVIFFDQGREPVEKIHKQNFPEMVTSDLPNLESLKKAASGNSYEVIKFIDEPNSLYLVVLKRL